MERLLLHVLSDDVSALILSRWLDVRSLLTLDTAVSSKTLRPYWMTLLRSLRATEIDNMDHSASSLMWMTKRGICPSRLQMKVDAWRARECDLSLLNIRNLLHIGLNECTHVTDTCILKFMVRSHRKRRRKNECSEKNDVYVSVKSYRCSILQSINLAGCD